jgi:hypothetical protein
LLIVIGTPTPETSVTVIWNAWYSRLNAWRSQGVFRDRIGAAPVAGVGKHAGRRPIGDLDPEGPARIGATVPGSGVLGHVILPAPPVVGGHETQDHVEAAQLEGAEQREIATGMIRVNIDEDEVPRVRPDSRVERQALGVTQRPRVVVGDHNPPGDAALQRVGAILCDRPPAETFLEDILDVSRGGGVLRSCRSASASIAVLCAVWYGIAIIMPRSILKLWDDRAGVRAPTFHRI